MTRPPLLFIAGGTGGHLHPCLAIAERLAEREGSPRPAWAIASQREVDRVILDQAKRDGLILGFTPIPAAPLVRTPRGAIRLITGWGRSVGVARRAIATLRREQASPIAVTTGGFVAPPAMHAARIEKLRRIAISLDAVHGRAIEWFGRAADVCFDAARDPIADARSSLGSSAWTPIGPIVRRAAMPTRSPAEARRAFDLDPDRPTMLVMGGSQGARTINDFVLAHIDRCLEAWRAGRWQAIHLAGPDDAERVAAAYAKADVPAAVHGYLEPVGDAWAAASLHLGRAGAGGVAEARMAGTPSVFMPYPFHRDMHQRANAEPLVAAGRAIMLDDRRTAEANLAAHGETLTQAMHRAAASEADRSRERVAQTSAPTPDGAEAVALHLATLDQ